MVDVELLKIVGQVAGIGGIAIGVLLLVFRDVIRKKIFPMLTKEQGYKLLRLILLLVWLVALAGIGAWIYVSTYGPRPPPFSAVVSGKLSLDETRSSWIAADSDSLNRFAPPPLRKDVESYRPSQDESVLVTGLWAGDIFAGLDPLARMTIQRDILKIVPKLGELKRIYQKQEGVIRTPEMDAAWELIPDERRRQTDLVAFGRFMRLIYPEPWRKEAGAIQLRDQLVKFMAKFWEVPETNRADEASLRMRLLYDIMLCRTSPVFRLRLNNPTDTKIALQELVVLVDAFLPMKDTGVSGPVQELVHVRVDLRGNKSPRISKPLNVAIAHKDVADILVEFESTAKGAYQLRIQVSDGDHVVYETGPFNLFFTS